jgi:hypothetical protein
MFVLAVLVLRSLQLTERPELHALSAAAESAHGAGETSAPEDGGLERAGEDAFSCAVSELQLGSAPVSNGARAWTAGLSRGRAAPGAPFKPPRT